MSDDPTKVGPISENKVQPLTDRKVQPLTDRKVQPLSDRKVQPLSDLAFYPSGLSSGPIVLREDRINLSLTGPQGATGIYTPYSLTAPSDEELRLRNRISELLQRFDVQRSELGDAKAESLEYKQKLSEANKTVSELQERQRLNFVLSRIHEQARPVLLESVALQDKFLKSDTCTAFVMSIDIRRSTELMLKSRTPDRFAQFITRLCSKILEIVINNHGVLDKFTGDGILTFFPNFYSGKDAGLYAVKAADECHRTFVELYKESRDCFVTVLKDVGLGIGVDLGEIHLVQIADGLTVVGTPVVYACRLSGGSPGKTLLNQPAYEELSKCFSAYCILDESELDVKHEGRVVAYEVRRNGNDYQLEDPAWRKYVKDRPIGDSSEEFAESPAQNAEGA